MLTAGVRKMRAICREWRAVARAAFAAISIIPTTEGVAFVAFCVVHPINPLCCPTPCPVYDSAKVADFINEAEQAWQKVEQCRQIADRYLSLVTIFGPNGPLATELRRVPGTVSDVLKTFTASAPGMLNPGDLSNPRAVAEVLKASLFDPNSLNVVKLTDSIGRVSQRAAIITDEAVNALATGLHGYKRLTDVAADRGQQTVLASNATNVRSDLAANASARQALMDNLAGLEELVSSWAATEATASSATHSATIGTLPSASNSSQTSLLAASLQTETDRLNRLRQMRIAVNQLDVTTSALTALHNERHAAAVMLAQYPGLWNTVASDDKAIQFRGADAASAVAFLSQVFVDGNSAFQLVQAQLLALDATIWKDSATKMQEANAAAQVVVQSIFSNPQSYGALQTGSAIGVGDNNLSAQFSEALVNCFSSWLEDDKLERFWAPLRQDAVAAIASLDQRFGEINNRLGFDISSSVAIDRENALSQQFNQQLKQILALGQQDADDGQRAALTSYISAFQAAVSFIQSDSSATNVVTVRWPS